MTLCSTCFLDSGSNHVLELKYHGASIRQLHLHYCPLSCCVASIKQLFTHGLPQCCVRTFEERADPLARCAPTGFKQRTAASVSTCVVVGRRLKLTMFCHTGPCRPKHAGNNQIRFQHDCRCWRFRAYTILRDCVFATRLCQAMGGSKIPVGLLDSDHVKQLAAAWSALGVPQDHASA